MMAVCRISAIPAHRFLFSLARNLCGSFVFQSVLVNWHFDAILLKNGENKARNDCYYKLFC